MGLETGTGIGDLVPTNPLSTDAVSAGDDHIRLIKTVMQSITFLKSIQTFTAFSSTWTRPTNVRKILIYCLGGGGGGTAGTTGGFAGGGGASGATAIKWLDVTLIPSAQVMIGTGGAGGTGSGGAGSDGLSTTFTTGGGSVFHCVALQGRAAAGVYGGTPHPAASSTGDIVFAGGYGSAGEHYSPAGGFGGTGGGSGGMTDNAALPNSGGGGGGGFSQASAFGPGGAGGTGYCIVFEFGW
jgi:hypothetical protein